MICPPCRNRDHARCYDETHGTDYRSCYCQHWRSLEEK